MRFIYELIFAHTGDPRSTLYSIYAISQYAMLWKMTFHSNYRFYLSLYWSILLYFGRMKVLLTLLGPHFTLMLETLVGPRFTLNRALDLWGNCGEIPVTGTNKSSPVSTEYPSGTSIFVRSVKVRSKSTKSLFTFLNLAAGGSMPQSCAKCDQCSEN